MTEDDIAQVRDAFVDGAKRALRVGFDAIELHMAHGYLMHSLRLADLQPAQRLLWRRSRRAA